MSHVAPTGLTTLPYYAHAIRTERLLLRPLTEADADDVFEYQSRPDVVRYLPWPVRDRAESAEHTRTRAGFTRLEDNNDALILAAELVGEAGDSGEAVASGDSGEGEDSGEAGASGDSGGGEASGNSGEGDEPGRRGRVIGDLSVFLTSGANAQIEIGWVFHPDFQGKGYATEAAKALLELAFTEIGAHRVSARLDPLNTASVALCRRLGMRQEAHFVEGEIFKGEWGDLAVWAILDREWAAKR